MNQYLLFILYLLVKQDFNTLGGTQWGYFSAQVGVIYLNTAQRDVSCEGVLTSCLDFVLGNYILALLIDIEYGIFLFSMSILFRIDAMHMGLLSYLRSLLLTSQENEGLELRLLSS